MGTTECELDNFQNMCLETRRRALLQGVFLCLFVLRRQGLCIEFEAVIDGVVGEGRNGPFWAENEFKLKNLVAPNGSRSPFRHAATPTWVKVRVRVRVEYRTSHASAS